MSYPSIMPGQRKSTVATRLKDSEFVYHEFVQTAKALAKVRKAYTNELNKRGRHWIPPKEFTEQLLSLARTICNMSHEERQLRKMTSELTAEELEKQLDAIVAQRLHELSPEERKKLLEMPRMYEPQGVSLPSKSTQH